MTPARQSKADLHVHSKHSNRPAEWFLRRIGAPECFVEPLQIYERAHERGMDFVTIADHNSISGALEIAHLPGVFLSCEATTYFPEDGCKVHCLVSGIMEEQFAMIQELRPSIYELHKYLVAEDIIHTINHPLFRVNNRLTIDHVEKLLVLFKRFESINGMRHPRAATLVAAIFENLTPELIAAMAERHGLEPVGPEPWKKWFVGGSDDHSGVNGASAYTVTPPAAGVDEFLEHLRAGRHGAAGSSGSSLMFGRSLYHIAYDFYRDRFLKGGGKTGNLFGKVIERLLGKPGASRKRGLSRYVPGFAVNFIRKRRMRKMGAVERSLVEEFSNLLREGFDLDGSAQASADRRTFQTVSQLAHLLGFKFLSKCAHHVSDGRLVDSLQTVASLGPVALGVGPYLAAFATQHKDDKFLDAVTAHFPAAQGLLRANPPRALVTDAFGGSDDISQTIQALGTAAQAAGHPLTVLTALAQTPQPGFALHNFAPVGTFNLPEYDFPEVTFPPFMDVLEYIEARDYGELLISTPGPLGLTALGVAKLLRLPAVGVYHADYALWVRRRTRDHLAERLTARFVRWFYSQMDLVLTTCEHHRRQLVTAGLDADRVLVMGHGVDLQRFQPGKRDAEFWKRRGLTGSTVFLFAGDVLADKNLELLLRSFQSLRTRRPEVSLAIVGDGPALTDLQWRFQHPQIAFTGFLGGEELAAAYASADVLVLPSAVDALSIAVLEGQAAGLPAIVAERGAAPEIVGRNQSGLMVDVALPGALEAAMERLAADSALTAEMRQRALRTAQQLTWEGVVERVWSAAARRAAPPSSSASPGAADAAAGLIALDVA